MTREDWDNFLKERINTKNWKTAFVTYPFGDDKENIFIVLKGVGTDDKEMLTVGWVSEGYWYSPDYTKFADIQDWIPLDEGFELVIGYDEIVERLREECEIPVEEIDIETVKKYLGLE